MPAAPECLSMNISSMHTAKEHFCSLNSTVAGDSHPRWDVQPWLTALSHPEHSSFFLWVEKVGSEWLDPSLQPSEYLHSSVLPKLNASSGVGL